MKQRILLLSLFCLVVFSACGLVRKGSKADASETESLENEYNFTFNQKGDMVLIQGGTIDVGSRFNKNEMPVHSITIPSFYLDVYEVSVAQYREFCRATGRIMPKQPSWNYDNHPVVNVTWEDANAYAKWAGKRLPTELEWEYAARSGRNNEHYYVSYLEKHTLGNVADEALKTVKFHYPSVNGYNDGFVYTAPVGSFKPNKYGVYDLDGNVLEWCSDWFVSPYQTDQSAGMKQQVPSGRYRVIRGVSWNRGRDYIRSTFRTYYPPTVQYDFIGFRCASDYVQTTLAANKH